MQTEMDQFALWRRTLADQPDGLKSQREILRQAFLGFRARTAQLVSEIGGLLPHLTVHDITHLDALWRVADEIAGSEYPLNPAEAFVLGGSFLLHDAAHVLAAYDDGLAGIKGGAEWKDLVAHRFDGTEPDAGSAEERSALFQILRHLHARQARQLPRLSWKVPSTGERLNLLESFDLRDYYGDLIGQIAESHHWPAHRVVETLDQRYVSAPASLAPAAWVVDALKVAFLLRTADAAHIDGQRAPWFLFALRCPSGISQSHWKFQAKMGQPKRNERGELRLSSGSPFRAEDQQAWWLAYETACMIDRELRGAHALMHDAHRIPFAADSVEHVGSPEAFATNVKTLGWEPVNVAPKIGNVAKVIASLGGAALYGELPEAALRELIQNAADAVQALRALGGIEQHEGKIEIALSRDGNSNWLHVSDTGIGMSRFVLTEVLLDFGNSLWSSESLLTELPGLASKEFRAVGRFGIGFFSIFMLGQKVKVITRRFRRAIDDASDQWLLEFANGLDGRPALRQPSASEELLRPGTRVSIALDDGILAKLLAPQPYDPLSGLLTQLSRTVNVVPTVATTSKKVESTDFARVVASLCPTLDIEVCVRVNGEEARAVSPNDWKTLTPDALISRLYLSNSAKINGRLIDLREDSGVLVGRIGYERSYFAHAITTHRGIKSGMVPGFVGVALGHNNVDLVRRQSLPVASRATWARWAKEWIASVEHHDPDALADIHPLISEHDLPVYRLARRLLTEAQLSEWLQPQSEIFTCSQLEHDDYRDQVSKDRFEHYFEPSDGIVFLPWSKLTETMGFPDIDYRERVESALRAAWGSFERWDEETCVGEVKGVEIIRWGSRYTRR